MPRIDVLFYRDDDGTVPLIEWLDKLDSKALDKCRVAIDLLRQRGHELRRPQADYLRDGIYELRVGLRGINYRLLYFFHGRQAVVVSHAIVKKRVVPPKEIDRATGHKKAFEEAPQRHTYFEE